MSSAVTSDASPAATIQYNRLGSSDLVVSDVCLGTMTWGLRNTEAEAHEQLDYALTRGINFIDTAEMYPTPAKVANYSPGRTEQYIGTWLASRPGVREKIVLATKVAGYQVDSKIAAQRYDPPLQPPYPTARLDRANIRAAIAASLRRLQTDYIDLYQLHWPDRFVPNFGKREYRRELERDAVPIRETLLAVKELMDEKKIRSYGLSNESTWGVCEYVRIADELGMPRPATIQNPFCLLDRTFESELAEACSPRNLNIGLLPWSILAGGMLTGKYLDNINEDGELMDNDGELSRSRFVLHPHYQLRFKSKGAVVSTHAYQAVAKEHGLSLTAMAHAFCKSRWFIPSTIVGATSIEQLRENIDAFDVELSERVLADIDKVHNGRLDPITSV